MPPILGDALVMNLDELNIIFNESKSSDGREILISSGKLRYICDYIDSIDPGDRAIGSPYKIAIRCIRNACINSSEVATFIGLHFPDIFGKLLQYCKCRTTLSRVTSMQEPDTREPGLINRNDDIDILVAISQFFSNFTANGTSYNILLWDRVSSTFNDLIALAVSFKCEQAISASVSCMYNSLLHSQSYGQELSSLILSNKLLFCQIFLSLMDLSVPSSIQEDKSRTVGGKIVAQSSLQEWLHILVAFFFREGYLNKLHNLIGSTNIQCPVSCEQIILIRIVSSLFEELDILGQVSDEAVASYLDLVGSTLVLIKPPLLFTNRDDIEDSINDDSIEIGLEAIATMLAYLDPTIRKVGLPIRQKLGQYNLISYCGELLQICQNTVTEKFRKDEDDRCRQIYVLSLQVLGNVVAYCHANQNILRECGVFQEVLKKTVTDFRFPMAREWAVFCVKVACENNESNQLFVQNFQKTRHSAT